MPVDWTPLDHASVALSRLLSQFADKPRFRALIAALAAGVQQVEDAIDDLITLRTLEAATGASLDQYGAIVGEVRGGLPDDDYRRFITARILVNKSRGDLDSLSAILAILFGVDELDDIEHYEAYPMSTVFTVVDRGEAVFRFDTPGRGFDSSPFGRTVSTEVAGRIRRAINDARAAGTRVDVVEVGDSATAFRFDTAGHGFNQGLFGRTV